MVANFLQQTSACWSSGSDGLGPNGMINSKLELEETRGQERRLRAMGAERVGCAELSLALYLARPTTKSEIRGRCAGES